MSQDYRLRRLEARDDGVCPKCGRRTGDINCATPEQIAQVDAELQEAFAELDERIRGGQG